MFIFKKKNNFAIAIDGIHLQAYNKDNKNRGGRLDGRNKKEWLDIINNTPRKDVPVCYDIATAAIGNEKAREWIKSHFAGAESMLDIYLISKAYSSRMSDAEIIKAAKEAEKSLNRIAAVINEAGNIPDDIEERERN